MYTYMFTQNINKVHPIVLLYNKTLSSFIYMYTYMFTQNIKKVHPIVFYIIKLFAALYLYNKPRHSYIAGQTAGPNGLIFFVDTYGCREVL